MLFLHKKERKNLKVGTKNPQQPHELRILYLPFTPVQSSEGLFCPLTLLTFHIVFVFTDYTLGHFVHFTRKLFVQVSNPY